MDVPFDWQKPGREQASGQLTDLRSQFMRSGDGLTVTVITVARAANLSLVVGLLNS
ncbi:MAG: hypothetical protein LAO30_00640 [Acidobacteriia bacterium]|nr:hypothetical protein [Terriglobia bacterium]